MSDDEGVWTVERISREEEKLPLRWISVSDMTYARRNTHPHTLFGAPMADSGKRWMCIVGVTLERSQRLRVEDLLVPWLQTRFEQPVVALRYSSTKSANVSTYTVPTAAEAEEWARSTIMHHENVMDPLKFLSEGNAYPPDDGFATVNLFDFVLGRQQLYIQVCHGWVGAYGAWAIFDALLKHLTSPAADHISWGPEVQRLPRSSTEALGFTRPDYKPPQAALDYVEGERRRLQVLNGSRAFPLPDYQPPPHADPLAIHHIIAHLTKEQSQAAIKGFRRHNLKLGDGLLHLACIGLYRLCQELAGGEPPPDDAVALLTLPMDISALVPSRYAVRGAFAPIIAKHLTRAAQSFADDASRDLDLRIPIIDGLIADSKASRLATLEADEQFTQVLMNAISALSPAQWSTFLGCSMMGQLDASGLLQQQYGTGENTIKISMPLGAAVTEMQILALRMWSFDGELCIRTVGNVAKVAPSIITRWHDLIMSMLERVSVYE